MQGPRSLLIVGSFVHVWPKGASRATPPVHEDSIIGVYRDASGNWHPVPSPLPSRGIIWPRIAEGAEGRWRVLFFTGDNGQRGELAPQDSATVWYGEFDNGEWVATTTVARTRAGNLRPGAASGLVANRTELAFAYAFGAHMEANGRQGIVLLSRRSGAWRADTLRTSQPALAVSMASSRDGSLLIAFTSTYFHDRQLGPQSLFVIRRDSGSHQPLLIRSVAGWSIIGSSIWAFHDTTLLAWQRVPTGDAGANVAEWTWLDKADSRIAMDDAPIGGFLEQPGVVPLTSDHLLLGGRSQVNPDEMRVLFATVGRTIALASIPIAMKNVNTTAVAESDSTALFVSLSMGSSPADPPAWSTTTEATIHCGRSN